MDDLIAFLRARLDDDEAAARVAAALTRSPWTTEGSTVMCGDGLPVAGIEDGESATAAHIARWDPVRVLAEVDAKRRILDLHTGEHDCPEMHTGIYPADWPASAPWGKAGECWAHPSVEHFEADQPCPTVRLLALPYAGQDGYREEWRP